MGIQNQEMRATEAGAIAILIWTSLSLLTVWSGKIPPFQLCAVSTLIATLVGLVMIFIEGVDPRLRHLNTRAMMLGVAGLFGYHFFFFLALRHAPVLEASLVNYLWPLLIVLFSALLPAAHQQSGLRWWHIAGALLGFSGAALILFADADKGAGSFAGNSWLAFLVELGAGKDTAVIPVQITQSCCGFWS